MHELNTKPLFWNQAWWAKQMDQLSAWIFRFASGKDLDPKAFSEDAIWQVQFWANINLSSADFHYLPAAWPHKSLLAKEGKNVFHLAVKSAGVSTYLTDIVKPQNWTSKRCYRSGKIRQESEALQWKGRNNSMFGFPMCRLHNWCWCATWEVYNIVKIQ